MSSRCLSPTRRASFRQRQLWSCSRSGSRGSTRRLSFARCSAAFATGGLCTARTRRFSSRKSTRRAREAAVDFTHGTELGVTIGGRLFPHLFLPARTELQQLAVGQPGLRRDVRSALSRRPRRAVGARWRSASAAERQPVRRDSRAQGRWPLADASVQGRHRPLRPGVDPASARGSRTKTASSRKLTTSSRPQSTKRCSCVAAASSQRSRSTSASLRRSRASSIAACRRVSSSSGRASDRCPQGGSPSHTPYDCVVRRWSTVRINSRVYSVPSRLIGP